MYLQSVNQIPVGDYIVTEASCMALRRYVLKICFKVSEYTESLTFEGKGLKYFGNMYRALYCAAGWLIQSNCQAQYIPSCHDITFFGFFVIGDRRYFQKAIYLYRDVFSCIDLIELRRDRLSMLSVSMFSLGFRALSREGIRRINFLK